MPGPKKPHLAWFVAGITFVVLLAAAGVRATPGILMVPLERELGWSPVLISGAISINLILYGLVGPFAAAVMQAFGVRRTVAASLLLLAVGVALTSLMTRPWQLYLCWGVLVGLGTGTTAMVLGATVVQRWFVERRGLVMGMLTASTATGQLVFLPMLAWIVEHQGFRHVSLTIAGVLCAVLPVAWFLLRDSPEELGLAPYGAPAGYAAPDRSQQRPLQNALGALKRASVRRDFWLLAGSFFVCGATTNGLVGTHLVPACMDHGIPEVRAAGLLAVMGIFDLFGTTLSGWLTDRHDGRWLLFWYYGLRGIALLYLPLAFDRSFLGLPVFAMFYGLDWIATVPPTLRLTSQTVGPADAPIAFGWIVAAHQIGASFGNLGAGFVRGHFESYGPAFVAAGVLCMSVSLVVLRIGKPSQTSTQTLQPETAHAAG